jgi:hypothetical protein
MMTISIATNHPDQRINTAKSESMRHFSRQRSSGQEETGEFSNPEEKQGADTNLFRVSNTSSGGTLVLRSGR